MKRGLITAILCLVIGVFFQALIMEIAPRLLCNEVLSVFLPGLKNLAPQYLFFAAILLSINGFALKIKRKENLISLAIFTAIYILSFFYIFYKYASKCVDTF